jgi:hypothetical protein
MRALLGFLLCAAFARGDTLLERGFREMYNLQFDDAHRTFAEHAARNPEDPLGPVSDAAAWLFSEFDRLHILQSELFIKDENFLNFRKPAADPRVGKQFEAALARTKLLADAAAKSRADDCDAMFASLLRLGLHSDYLALIERRELAALSEVKQSRAIADKLLTEKPDYYDAYIAVGLENYLLSLKPAPVRWLLRAGGAQTDKHTGIEKLRMTAEKGHYLLPYARLLLAVADLRDGHAENAREKLEWLAREFPDNRLYREELAKLKRGDPGS